MLSRKVILIGDFGTGKTSLIRRFVDNQFSDSYLSTIGVKISQKKIDGSEGALQMLIWDIEGGTSKKPVNTTYIRGAHGCIVVSDITREETIEHVGTYLTMVRTIVPSSPVVLMLNKSDLIDEEKSEAWYKEVKDRYGSETTGLFLTSAKNGEGVETAFRTLAKHLRSKDM